MKKQLLLAGLALFVGISANAQVSVARLKPVAVTGKMTPVPLKRMGYDHQEAKGFDPSNLLRSSSALSAVSVTPIVQTAYDEQREGSLVNVPGTNKLSVAVTGSQKKDAAFPDRGVYYCFFDGSIFMAKPKTRIEGFRTGWPTITVTKSGQEVVVTHLAQTNKTVVETRPVAGTGAWAIDSNKALVGMWPRVCAGGASGNDIHIITTNYDKDTTDNLYYYRSTDGGVTYDIKMKTLPNNRPKLGGNFVSMDARGKTIAVAVGGATSRPYLYKSVDNGVTWTETTIWTKMPVDYGKQGVLTDNDKTQAGEDSAYNSDGMAKVFIDNNNVIHWFSGSMRYKRTDINAASGSFSFYPTDPGFGMLYWNDKFPTDSVYSIASPVDNNNDKKFTPSDSAAPITAIPNYGNTGPVSMPTCSYDSVKNVFSLVFPMMTEFAADTTVKPWVDYRDIYVITVTDITKLYDTKNFLTSTVFSAPINLTQNPHSSDAKENVFPSAARYNSAADAFSLPIIWQQDPDLGTQVSAKSYAIYTRNQIVFNNAVPTGINSLLKSSNSGLASVATPNPFNSTTQISISAQSSGNAVLTVFNTMGQKVIEKTAAISAGVSHPFTLSKDELSKGMYIYTVKVGEKVATQKLIVE